MLDTVENETERKEIASFTCMVRAWQRMKMADARSSPDLYAQASELFSKAKTCDLEDKQMLLASGNSAICKALEHGMLFEETRRKAEFSKAKNHLESALGFYLRAGLERASEWTAATEILLDAYSYLTDAEKEVNLSNRTRKLLLAEKCFEQSAKLYQRANYSGRRDEVIKVIAKVRQKREFTLSLGKLLTTPGEASTTKAIPAPTLAIGEAVGLDKFERELIQANLVTPKRDVLTAEDFSIELHVANLGKTPTFLVKAENMLQEGLDAIVESPTYDIENHDVDTKGKRLDPSQSITFKFKLRSLSKGVLEIKPKIVCLDETGRQAFYEPEPLTIRVTETILPKRVTTGHRELDLLSMGGIPKNFAVLLSSTSSDERATLIYDFLESGARNDQVTFYVAVDIRGKERLAEQSSKFWVFICNPRADEMVKDKPNVSKLKGVENLTDISIALTSALRNLETSELENRRLCLEIISDVLLHHHAVSTRRWLASIIPEFRSHGFTTLAVLNPQMHPAQEVQAILDIFDGEITIQEKQTNKGPQKLLAIRRLSNEKYLTSELSLKTQNDRLL
jgi:KaiC/GvpD/RAD55 family RecA-like ATPase